MCSSPPPAAVIRAVTGRSRITRDAPACPGPVSKVAIATLTAAALLTFAVFRVADFWWWRGQTLNAAEARAGNLSLIVSEYIRGSFAAGDASLRQLALHSGRIGGPAAPDHEWQPLL